MSYNPLSEILGATTQSYYNSPRNSRKNDPITYGTTYKDRFSSSEKYDEIGVKPYRERITEIERTEDYLSSPFKMTSSVSTSKLSHTFSGREDYGRSNMYTRLEVIESPRYGSSPRHNKLSQSTFVERKQPSIMHHEKKTLVLDLDETLVHASPDPIGHYDFVIKLGDSTKFYVAKRPGLDDFLERMSRIYELVVYTAAEKEYATAIIEKIDLGKRIKHVLHRDHCPKSVYGLDKDLLLLGKDLKGVIFIDNLEENFRLQQDNGLKIIDFYASSRNDDELKKLIPFLEYMADLPDVRPIKHWHVEFHTNGGRTHEKLCVKTVNPEALEDDSHKAASTLQRASRREEIGYSPRSRASYRAEQKLLFNNEKLLETNERPIAILEKELKERDVPLPPKTQYDEKTRNVSYRSAISDLRHGETYIRDRPLEITVNSAENYFKKPDEERPKSRAFEYPENDWNYSPRKQSNEDQFLKTWSSFGNSSYKADYLRPSEGVRKLSDYADDELFRKTTDRWNDRWNYDHRVRSNSRERTKETPLERFYDKELSSPKSSDSFYSESLNSSWRDNNESFEARYQRKNDEFDQFSRKFSPLTPQKRLFNDSERLNDSINTSEKRSKYDNKHDEYMKKILPGPITPRKSKVDTEKAENSALIDELYQRIAFLEKKLKEKGITEFD